MWLLLVAFRLKYCIAKLLYGLRRVSLIEVPPRFETSCRELREQNSSACASIYVYNVVCAVLHLRSSIGCEMILLPASF
jgi:hypothetical protein